MLAEKAIHRTVNHTVGTRDFLIAVFLVDMNGRLQIVMCFQIHLFITCRIASRKKSMIHTWMDCVICFAFVGVSFELIENMAFGAGENLLFALLRALASAHFAFGTFMGYYYGKSRVTGKNSYLALCFFGPVIFHSVVNGLMSVEKPSSRL